MVAGQGIQAGPLEERSLSGGGGGRDVGGQPLVRE